jgi:MerR HTH family regulatory protein
MNSDEYKTRSSGERTGSGSIESDTNQNLTFGAADERGNINADKPVYTLSVAADILGLHPRTLRIYEEHELVVPARTPTKRRRYSQNDIRKLQFIQHLTHDLGVNLAGVDIILQMMAELSKHGVDYSEALLKKQPKDL